jgi:mannose-6-phosphate isomerase-like protein (cupin superfamily)
MLRPTDEGDDMPVIRSHEGQAFEPAPGATLRTINGAEHALGDVGLILSRYPPGAGNPAHRHTYQSAIVLAEGQGVFTIEDEDIHASEGDIVVVPAHAWHSFRNDGTGPLRCVGIDLGSGTHETELREPFNRSAS